MITGFAGRPIGSAAGNRRGASARWLLLHGFTGTSEDWSELWPETQPALAIDLPGHGGSAAPVGNYEAEIARLLAALPMQVDGLAGYSLGGRIALSLMAAAPRRFRRLIILSAHPGLEDQAERSARRAADQHWVDRLCGGDIKGFAAAWQRQPLFRDQHKRAPAAVAAQQRRRLQQCPIGLARSLECFGLGQMPPTWSAIRRFGGRLDWITGAEDEKFRRLANRVRALRPATRHAVIPACGHNPLIEAPDALRHQLEHLIGGQ